MAGMFAPLTSACTAFASSTSCSSTVTLMLCRIIQIATMVNEISVAARKSEYETVNRIRIGTRLIMKKRHAGSIRTHESYRSTAVRFFCLFLREAGKQKHQEYSPRCPRRDPKRHSKSLNAKRPGQDAASAIRADGIL